jgi:hypothetical protein
MTLFLRRNREFRCPVVIAELRTQCTEIPDVLGFHGLGSTVLIECKVSRADFLADKDKWFRAREEKGVGDHRYYAAPAGMLSPEELPDGWGLLEVTGGTVRRVRKAEFMEANKRAEVAMLMSAMRRLELSTAVFVQQGDGF